MDTQRSKVNVAGSQLTQCKKGNRVAGVSYTHALCYIECPASSLLTRLFKKLRTLWLLVLKSNLNRFTTVLDMFELDKDKEAGISWIRWDKEQSNVFWGNLRCDLDPRTLGQLFVSSNVF